MRRLFIDPARCIGCGACMQACAECPSHRGIPMIHVDLLRPGCSPETTPTVCMHCDDPPCAQVCPADAIKRTVDGIVHSALPSRCIGCGNCVLACPFGVPRYLADRDQMMKCDLCYDRTARGQRPMCASVCPSGALVYGEDEEVAHRRHVPVQTFRVARQTIRTLNALMVAPVGASHPDHGHARREESYTQANRSPIA